MTPENQRQAFARAHRAEHGRVLATVARWVGDLGQAEELVQQAWLRALERWPREGWPQRPGAWLATAARRLAIDEWRAQQRRRSARGAAPGETARELEARLVERFTPKLLRDDPLRLMFACCDPALPREAQLALTLHTLGGLTVAEIAQAFLADERAIAQRLVRAKRRLRAQRVAFRIPTPYELPARLPALLDVLYLMFSEGYAASAGAALVRRELCEEAIRLARLVVESLPSAEALGLLALLELQASRLAARTDAQGRALRLEEQDRSRWDRALVGSGLARLAAARRAARPGSFVLQAEIAACHARAARFADTDWRQIVALYDRLERRLESPVVAVNRAVALAFRDSPEAGLAALATCARDPRLRRWAWLPTARADLLRRAGRYDEAAREYARAETLMSNAAERAYLAEQRQRCEAASAAGG